MKTKNRKRKSPPNNAKTGTHKNYFKTEDGNTHKSGKYKIFVWEKLKNTSKQKSKTNSKQTNKN